MKSNWKSEGGRRGVCWTLVLALVSTPVASWADGEEDTPADEGARDSVERARLLIRAKYYAAARGELETWRACYPGAQNALVLISLAEARYLQGDLQGADEALSGLKGITFEGEPPEWAKRFVTAWEQSVGTVVIEDEPGKEQEIAFRMERAGLVIDSALAEAILSRHRQVLTPVTNRPFLFPSGRFRLGDRVVDVLAQEEVRVSIADLGALADLRAAAKDAPRPPPFETVPGRCAPKTDLAVVASSDKGGGLLDDPLFWGIVAGGIGLIAGGVAATVALVTDETTYNVRWGSP